nr:PAS domain-containing protein [Rhizobium halophytocola]
MEFEALARVAAIVCGTPISLISLIDHERQWFKANIGLEGISETSREISFCAHTILGDRLVEVQDASEDPLFQDNPMVTAGPEVRFYAGVPLTLTSGDNVGTLCVVGREPKALSADQKEVLQHLAHAAARALEARVAFQRERSLAALESQSKSILQHSLDAILTMNAAGVIEQWNAAAESLFGYTAEEARGQPLQLILAADRQVDEADLAARLRNVAGMRSMETVRRHKDGFLVPVSVSIGPVVSAAGETVGATEIIRDNTEAIRVREDLIEAEQRVSRLYQATPAMLHSIDSAGRILSVSDRWLQVMGYRREEVIGRLSSSYLTEASRAYALATALPAFFKAGHCENIEYEMVTRSGAVIDVLLSAILERAADGTPLRTMAVIENISDRRAIERALRDERRRLQQIIEGTQAGTWEWNVQTGEMRINSGWTAVVGYTLEELEPVDLQTWQQRVHPDDIKENWKRLEAHFAGETDYYACETRLRHKDGRWVWVIDRGRVLTWTDDGRPEWMFGTHQDITQRKKEEDELRKSQDFLDRTGRIAGVGGWEVDLAAGTVVWSDETCRIHGVAPGHRPTTEEALGFYPPEARPLIEAAIRKSMDTGANWDLVTPFITKSGRNLWVRTAGSTHFENGMSVRMSGAFQDVTEQVEQRIALEEVNERIAVATENGLVGIWDANLETGKSFYSDIWCRLIGYTRDELSDSGMQWLEFVHPDDRQRAQNADIAHVRGETPYFEEQFRMRHKDGHWVWILDRGRVTARNAAGEPTRMIGTHTDITRQKQAEEERLLMGERMAIATDSGGIGIWDVGIADRVMRWDAWMYRLYGLPERAGLPVRDLWRRALLPEDRQRMETAVLDAIGKSRQLDEEFRIVWPDRSIHHIRVSAKVVTDQAEGPGRLIGAAWDVTEQRRMAIELAEQHELMRVTLHSIGDAVITTNAEGIVQWLNPVAERMTGWTAQEAKGQPSSAVFHIVEEESRAPAADPIRACLDLGEVVGLAEDTLLISRDGGEFGIEDSAAPIRNASGRILGVVLVFHDVSEQRRLSREMSYRASHDPLTGLINRLEFDRRLNRIFEKAKLERSRSALLYIDLDQFKIVNDTCGHSVGDTLLKQVSGLMADSIRSGDILARLGGDEFAVILDHCPIEMAERIAQKICDRMADFHFVHADKAFRVGTSIGLVPIDADSLSVAAVLQAADASCYLAKNAGRNRVHLWVDSDEVIETRSGETRWASRIEQALRDDRFALTVQPIVPLGQTATGRQQEIIVNMVDEDGTAVAPLAFLPHARRFNLATRIDRWQLAHVLEWMAANETAGDSGRICVSLSGQSLGDRAFHKFVADSLETAGEAVCRRLCFEIGESAAIANMADAPAFIASARGRGVAVAIDDFVGGASSFGYLKRFPVDYLRIDAQFIRGLLDDPLSEATVKCFVEVAGILGLKTIAKQVPDATTADRLRAHGVDFGQGDPLGKPVPLATIG